MRCFTGNAAFFYYDESMAKGEERLMFPRRLLPRGGYDLARMMFQFTMMTPDARSVAYEISSLAMDAIAGVRGTLPNGREAQFLRLRDRIEQIASDMFERDNLQPVRVFAKNVDFGGALRSTDGPPFAAGASLGGNDCRKRRPIRCRRP